MTIGQNSPKKFQSTLLVRGATGVIFKFLSVPRDFNPRSSWEERPWWSCSIILKQLFQSTLLVRGATEVVKCTNQETGISIHAPRERSDDIGVPYPAYHQISIHAPRERSDCSAGLWKTVKIYFNPRSSWEERPYWFRRQNKIIWDFNPRSSWEERLFTTLILYP